MILQRAWDLSVGVTGVGVPPRRDGWSDGWVDGGMGGWVGLQKLITVLDMRNCDKGGIRFGFININDMYNTDVGKGGVRGYEADEVK